MDWLALIFIVSLVVSFVSHILELRAEWRRNSAGFVRTIKLIAVYAAYCALGVAIVASGLEGPEAETRALGGTAMLLSWIFYGALWLARTAPRTAPVPEWLDRFPGLADYALLGTLAVGAAVYYG